MLILTLVLCALCTALLSGVFGMIGGMLLMGAYTALLPVPTAMVLHGGTQLLSNSMRAALLLRDVYWRGFAQYVVGALLALVVMLQVAYVPTPELVFLGLGAAPFVAACLPAGALDFQRGRSAVLVGALVASVQLLAGAAGPLLDAAFLDTQLTRTQVVATKAVTQMFSHVLKLGYFLPAFSASSVSPELAVAVFLATLAGTALGTWLLRRLSDASFRRYSRALVYGVGCVYLARAGLSWWQK